MRLLIISHTEHYADKTGNIAGWGPTVKEIDYLANAFDEVVHIACLHNGKEIPLSAIPYQSKNVRFVPIRPFGGVSLIDKLNIITTAWSNIKKIRKELKNADAFQFRAPASIGLYIIPYLTLFCKKKGWYKYAGNWVRENAPLSYRLQQWMLLSMQSRMVAINGIWENQPANCVSFENPCLTEEDRIAGLEQVNSRNFNKPYKLCFVGRLDKEKGIYKLLEVISQMGDRSLFSQLDIVGDGPELENIKQLIKEEPFKINVHGALSRAGVFEIYKQSDFIVLPSESEGFPKVIAEAANFGCIPIVSDVSAIGQYINSSNGFVWDSSKESFSEYFSRLDITNTEELKNKSKVAYVFAGAFTYVKYIEKIKKYFF